MYFTGPREVLFLPVTSLMRPLWLLTRYRDVRRSLFNFVDTLIKAADVLILFVLLIPFEFVFCSLNYGTVYSRNIIFPSMTSGKINSFVS